MPLSNILPIMPKENKTPMSGYMATSVPYPTSTPAGPRNAAIWNTADDEILLQARASGLNWQPIASRHFPNKTANACRKRHERLIERRHVEDWDADKLELLAQEYIAVRKEMWEVLAARLGERWAVVEAKCMEKGLKTLQSTARMAQRKALASGAGGSFDYQGTDHHSDSGIGICSDAEMEVEDDVVASTGPAHKASSSWQGPTNKSQNHYHDHSRSRSLPQPLPLYQPPPPVSTQRRTFDGPMMISPGTLSFERHTSYQRYSPDSQNGRGGFSIQSVLSPAEPQLV